MRVYAVDFFFDGGTAKIETNNGTYYIDERLGTDTPSSIYNKYPDDDGATVVNEVKQDLIGALYGFDSEIYNNAISQVINRLESIS